MAEGVGQIGEIEHCYRLTTNNWFARYEVRESGLYLTVMTACVRQWFVHRSFLEQKNRQIFTNAFEVEDRLWCKEHFLSFL